VIDQTLQPWVVEKIHLAKRSLGVFFSTKTKDDKCREHSRYMTGIANLIWSDNAPEHWINVGFNLQRFAPQASSAAAPLRRSR
jgi:hypothetical protein